MWRFTLVAGKTGSRRGPTPAAGICFSARFARVDWTHQGDVPTGFTYSQERPAYSELDAAIGFRRGHWEAALYGHNLTNSNGIVSIQEGTPYSYGNIFRTQISIPPRTIGVD